MWSDFHDGDHLGFAGETCITGSRVFKFYLLSIDMVEENRDLDNQMCLVQEGLNT